MNINDLQISCSFSKILEQTDEKGYRYKLAHIRADYDGHRWWHTIWPLHDELATHAMRCEVDAVYNALTAKTGFADLAALRHFCHSRSGALVQEGAEEYNFYYTGKLCHYWPRCILRDKDYNLYLHAFAKEMR